MMRFTVTLPKWLNDWLAERAKLDGRSKNKQIEHILKQAKQVEGDKPKEP